MFQGYASKLELSQILANANISDTIPSLHNLHGNCATSLSLSLSEFSVYPHIYIEMSMKVI